MDKIRAILIEFYDVSLDPEMDEELLKAIEEYGEDRYEEGCDLGHSFCSS